MAAQLADTGGDLVVRDIGRLLSMDPSRPWAIERGAVVIRAGHVEWMGQQADLPVGLDLPELSVEGACVLPGFVDPHTHVVWAGDRREELAARLAGESYAASGINRTVAATSAASDSELVALVHGRLDRMLRNGTTTVEVKSGYGLDPVEELRQLRVAAVALKSSPLRWDLTYLAHVPPADRDAAEHLRQTAEALPAARQLGARWFDVFCDVGAFSVAQAEQLLQAARAAGLGLRLHADQLERTGGAELAARSGCASADHLEKVGPDGARALADAGVVAVVMPTATLMARGDDWGCAQRLVAGGVELALATDCNPGTSWCESVPYAVQLGCWLMGLSVRASLTAATRGAARSLRREDVGWLGVGSAGDLAVLATDHEVDVVTHLGAQSVRTTVLRGVVQAWRQ